MLKQIPKSDIIVRPLKVYKEWTLDENDINPIFAKSGSIGDYDAEIEEKSYGYSKISLFRSIKAQFYLNPETSSMITEVGRRRSYTSKNERVLQEQMAVFSIPQIYYGEGIKPGTVVFTNDATSKTFTDDSYSNLIDSGSNVAGNIFYDRGLVVLTRDITSGSDAGNLTQFTLDFRSTKTIYENEIFIPVLEGEFNFSQNPSAVYEDGAKKVRITTSRAESLRKKPNDLVTTDYYDAGIKNVRNSKYAYVSKLDPNKFGSFDDYEYSGQDDLLDVEDYLDQIKGMSKGDAFDYLKEMGLERDEILTVLRNHKSSSLRESVEKDLADINKEAEHEVLQAKLDKIDALIDHRRSKLSKLDEDEDMKALTDKKKVKELEKDIKKLEVARKKVEKMMSKFKGKKAASKEVIDETEGEDELPLETPAEASAEYLQYKEDAENRYDAGESIDSILDNYNNISLDMKNMLRNDLEGKMDGMDY